MKTFNGIFPALLTPYDKSGAISASSVKKLIELNIRKGVSGFYVGGSTGEGLLLTVEERNALFKYAAEANGGRTTLIAHVGTISTAQAVEMAKYAESVGFDAVSAVAPYYYGYSYEAIKQYYKEIADSVSIPVIIYNYPNANGFNLDKKKVEEIFSDKRFLGIKHTSADLFALQQFKTVSKDIVVYNGFDEMLLGGLSMGANGGIGSTYNFMAEKYVALYECFVAGKLFEAQKLQFEANEIIAELIKYGVMACEKALMEEMDIEMGDCRHPFLPLSPEGKAAMKVIAKNL